MTNEELVNFANKIRERSHYATYRNPEAVKAILDAAKKTTTENGKLKTDINDALWVSPWEFEAETPEEFVMYMIGFDLETGDREIFFDDDRFPKELIADNIQVYVQTMLSVGVTKELINKHLHNLIGCDREENPEVYDLFEQALNQV
ncbi:hypothetical protein [Ectothiorhodospira shaposhnikovii]|uniref:hypothetical protein n=1 Tax=Ectothiorhodospira shaposhnikovii TaxID=1054 RepID=UPI001EE7C028|nr:hypothetical protein [Ectothiorhodospira shaposhnikovii]MCG5512821.1 hypothetical protein [Ectothiorhodospira shaposhnikovii]